jgi:hypothetical protein
VIIHSPSRIEVGADLQISARIELQNPRKGVPSELWFRFPKAYSQQISADIDPFAVALLLLAMKNQEPLEIRGALSRKLFAGLNEYQRIYYSWYPKRFRRIEIQPAGFREDTGESEGIATAFSGGVDSFYSFLTLFSKSTQPRPLTHALFMAGFDMPLNLKDSIAELTASFAEMMKNLGVSFVSGSTNVRNFVNSVDWTNSHGQALAASALFFRNDWKTFYIPSSYTVGAHPKWGTHPALDPLLSTESLQMIHHGAQANRVEKLITVSQAQESYDRLRVCWIQDLGLKNCGQCEKCIRTMTALEILGALHHYSTFDRSDWGAKKIRGLSQRTSQARLFARELMSEALRRGRFWIWLNLGYSLLRREIFFRSLKFKSRS